MRVQLLVVGAVLLTACGGPFLVFPGGALDYLKEDPRVRVRFGDKVYPLKAVLVGRPGELEGFDADRFVYRLDPRDPS